VTSVDFHFNAPDRLSHACRLVRKAMRSRAASDDKPLVVFCADEAQLQAFDDLLYTFSDDDFLPHVHADHPLADEAPVILCSQLWTPPPPRVPHLLINLDAHVPDIFSQFDRVFEIVSLDEADRQAARVRYAFYRDRGYPLTRYDLGQTQNG
jgi:DNA polymerase-3 subunit chi